MKQKDFISLRDFTADQVQRILTGALEVKANPHRFSEALKGKALALIFEKPSLRTRVTFDIGIQQLGGFSVYLSPAEINLGKRESVYDVAKNLERMVQGIMIRTFAHKTLLDLAAYAAVPVINGLTDFNHPCQALADYMTLMEVKDDLTKCKLAYVGDGNNVAHSLLQGAARLGVQIAIATPPGYEPKPEVVEWTRDKGKATGCRVTLTHNPAEAVEEADAVYTDVWASMGQEAEARERARIFQPYQVNAALFARAKPDAVFLHCLPAHRGQEVTDEVIDSPRSMVFQEAENRLHVQKQVMLTLMQ